MRPARLVICLLIGFLVAQGAFYYPNLPARTATHFDASGAANDWMTKESFVVFQFIILLFVTAEFFLLPKFIEKMPNSLINFPHKEFWLAPERRSATFAVARNYFEWLGAGLLCLFIAVNQTIFTANINRTNLSSVTMWTIIAAFILFTFVWMIKFTRHFKIRS